MTKVKQVVWTKETDTGGKITEAGLKALRNRAGVLIPDERETWYEFATRDSIRHFCHGNGDANPLWVDLEYAQDTRWRGIIAPPGFFAHMGVNPVTEIPPDVRGKGRGGSLPGVHGFHAGSSHELYRPVYEGDRLTKTLQLESVEEKKRSAMGGRSVLCTWKHTFWNQRGELVAIKRRFQMRVEREAGQKSGKHAKYKRPYYTAEMLQKIEAEIDNEEIRGPNPRYWEDVQVGDETIPIVRGPLLITDIIAHIRGAYSPFIRAHQFRLWYQRRHPRALSLNEFGVPDFVERVHWDELWAQKTGNPYAFDYGPQRESWMDTAVTYWMGDDAWLRTSEYSLRRFNYVGDTTWIRGKVTDKSVDEEGNHIAELDITCEDQRGETTAHGHAAVYLPSREKGQVLLPRPPRGMEGGPLV